TWCCASCVCDDAFCGSWCCRFGLTGPWILNWRCCPGLRCSGSPCCFGRWSCPCCSDLPRCLACQCFGLPCCLACQCFGLPCCLANPCCFGRRSGRCFDSSRFPGQPMTVHSN